MMPGGALPAPFLWIQPVPIAKRLSENDSAPLAGRTCDLTWPLPIFHPIPAPVIGLGLES